MQITITLDPTMKPEAIAKQFKTWADSFAGIAKQLEGAPIATNVSKPAITKTEDSQDDEAKEELKGDWTKMTERSAKAATAAGKQKPATKKSVNEEAENFDLGFDEAEETKEKELTLTEVIEGFRQFAKQYGNEKAADVLRKLKVASVREIPKDKYKSVLKMIEV